MKFLCLCYYDTAAFARLSAADAAKIPPACKPHDERLKATGKLAIVGSLAFPEQWSVIAPRNGKPRHMPGPYIADTQQAGAFFIVDARDADEAREVAAKHPAANFGEELGFAVEVHPCALYETHEVKK